jgi:diguanylate cyclase (GGDEF)-like protein
MYDPLVVDTFVKVHRHIQPTTFDVGPPPNVLNEIASARKNMSAVDPSPILKDIAASADEMLTLYDLARGLAGQVSFNDAGDVIANHLRRLIPSGVCVFYVHDRATGEIYARHAVGEAASNIKGIRISVGQRLSGWVAANRQTIANSDPVLDLGEIVRTHPVRLRSCLSTPLVSGDSVVGVLSLYSSEHNAFTDDHRRIIEAVGHQIAHTLEQASEFDVLMRRDALTGLPPLSQLERIVFRADGQPAHHQYSLVFIELNNMSQIVMTDGRAAENDVLRHVVRATRAGLRVADLLFRKSNNQLVAFLSEADVPTAEVVANRILANVAIESIVLPNGQHFRAEVSVHVVSCPKDGESLASLLNASQHTDNATMARPNRFIH